jgi:hypothetical protein
MMTSTSMVTTTSTCRRSSSSGVALPASSFAWTTRADGDLAGAPPPSPTSGPLAQAPAPWTWLRQVHGSGVVVVTEPGEHAGTEADAAVTAVPGCTLVVRTADCVPMVLQGEWSVAVLHLGWRSLLGGLVGATSDAVAALGDAPRLAHLGPHIHPGCYEFGEPELTALSDRFGPSVRSRTLGGRPALDLRAVVAAACAERGVVLAPARTTCTACDPQWFSHRARGDAGRMATAAWLEA